ncbi:hypothetical protein K490DRAFT_63806 [Saccharata proteae CBS 121410]|uniref:Uncharacterized protein n=1 Tax=Saccharata proteae CBS 121410 TaxID=1314787 RepID=A0A6A5YDS3_9PEZI|nr:hypothetical protein K490DRAFT_63806 [Saccharata proteae CBS 121410]
MSFPSQNPGFGQSGEGYRAGDERDGGRQHRLPRNPTRREEVRRQKELARQEEEENQDWFEEALLQRYRTNCDPEERGRVERAVAVAFYRRAHGLPEDETSAGELEELNREREERRATGIEFAEDQPMIGEGPESSPPVQPEQTRPRPLEAKSMLETLGVTASNQNRPRRIAPLRRARHAADEIEHQQRVSCAVQTPGPLSTTISTREPTGIHPTIPTPSTQTSPHQGTFSSPAAPTDKAAREARRRARRAEAEEMENHAQGWRAFLSRRRRVSSPRGRKRKAPPSSSSSSSSASPEPQGNPVPGISGLSLDYQKEAESSSELEDADDEDDEDDAMHAERTTHEPLVPIILDGQKQENKQEY